jgi:large conductance mechanosensitive channel
MALLKEFRDFAVKGNVVDLAVGVIIGAAFGKIVDSLVGDIIMPIVGRLVGSLDYSSMFIVLGHAPPNVPATLVDLKKAGVPVLAYGNFLTVLLNFLILAFIIFMMVRAINRLRRLHEEEKKAGAPEPTTPPEDILLLREIRDELKNRTAASPP